MAKIYCGIGYSKTAETKPGVWVETIIKRYYYGDLVRNTRRLQSGSNLNDSVNISNEISILADPFAYENFHSMRYVEFMGVKWKISNVDVQYPRLVLTVGGIHNENQK
jgi:hypothetical protein